MAVELLGVVLMIAAGSAVAMLVIVARIARGEKRHVPAGAAAPDRDGIAASLLFHASIAGSPPSTILIVSTASPSKRGTPQRPASSRLRARTRR